MLPICSGMIVMLYRIQTGNVDMVILFFGDAAG
jgi:hypothetical protein